MNLQFHIGKGDKDLLATRSIMIFLFFNLLSISSIFCQSVEYTMKAVAIEKISRFIEWPIKNSVDDSSETFVINVIGENPFGTILENIYSDRKIKNKPVKIEYISGADEIRDCHLLFISHSEKNKLGEIIAATKSKPILTVSDSKGFAEEGVQVNLLIINNKIRLEINESATNNTGISVSYKLIKVSKIINPIGGGN